MKMLPGIGIFGTGRLVRVLVTFLKVNGFKVEAIWGRTGAETSKFAQELDIPFHTTKIDDVLLRKDVDMVFIMCLPNLHAQISVKALGIGKHVLCDKPAGLCQSEALKMVRAAMYYPTLISIVNHSLRFLPAFSHMRKAIQSGYIGSIQLIDVRIHMDSLLTDKYDWLCDDTMGGGTLNLIGSHIIDLITHLTSRQAFRVHGVIQTFKKETDTINGIRSISAPDFCNFQMELVDGSLVTATISNYIDDLFVHEIMVCGTNGRMTVKEGDLYCYKQKEEILYEDKLDLEMCSSEPFPKPYMKGLYNMITALKEAFLPVEDKWGWVKEPVCNAATFDDGLYVQAVIDALKKSNANKEWTKVVILNEEPDPNPLLSAAVRKSAIAM